MIVHVFISGKVHGIGFRQYLRYKARKLNINGWVKNLSNGQLEAVFAGDEKNIRKMIGIAKRGPFLAEVSGLQIDWNYKTPEDLLDFTIIKV